MPSPRFEPHLLGGCAAPGAPLALLTVVKTPDCTRRSCSRPATFDPRAGRGYRGGGGDLRGTARNAARSQLGASFVVFSARQWTARP